MDDFSVFSNSMLVFFFFCWIMIFPLLSPPPQRLGIINLDWRRNAIVADGIGVPVESPDSVTHSLSALDKPSDY
jgi:hypothetical protein